MKATITWVGSPTFMEMKWIVPVNYRLSDGSMVNSMLLYEEFITATQIAVGDEVEV